MTHINKLRIVAAALAIGAGYLAGVRYDAPAARQAAAALAIECPKPAILFPEPAIGKRT